MKKAKVKKKMKVTKRMKMEAKVEKKMKRITLHFLTALKTMKPSYFRVILTLKSMVTRKKSKNLP